MYIHGQVKKENNLDKIMPDGPDPEPQEIFHFMTSVYFGMDRLIRKNS